MTLADDHEKPRILIVDDERFNVNTLFGLLRDDYQTMVATNGEQALKVAKAGMPDLILLDINMPDIDGLEVCRRLKSDPLTMAIPVIFITGLSESDDETRGLDLGAVDYIVKPFNLAVVKARVRTHVRLKMHATLLERFAMRDTLTGLPNRRALDDKLASEWSRCQRNASWLNVVLIDVDFFKLYNDHYGHGAGDECLAAVSKALSQSIKRASDMVARYGGEEFVAVIPETPPERASQLAERMRAAVEALALPHAASKVCGHVTCSLGVAGLIPGIQPDIAALLGRADAQLYQSKSRGRNRVSVDL